MSGRSGLKVVVDVLPPERSAAASIDQLKRDIEVEAGMQPPHIVAVLSAGETYQVN